MPLSRDPGFSFNFLSFFSECLHNERSQRRWTKKTIDPGSEAYRDDEGGLHTGKTKSGGKTGPKLDPGSTAYRDDGDSVPPRPLAALHRKAKQANSPQRSSAANSPQPRGCKFPDPALGHYDRLTIV